MIYTRAPSMALVQSFFRFLSNNGNIIPVQEPRPSSANFTQQDTIPSLIVTSGTAKKPSAAGDAKVSKKAAAGSTAGDTKVARKVSAGGTAGDTKVAKKAAAAGTSSTKKAAAGDTKGGRGTRQVCEYWSSISLVV